MNTAGDHEILLRRPAAIQCNRQARNKSLYPSVQLVLSERNTDTGSHAMLVYTREHHCLGYSFDGCRSFRTGWEGGAFMFWFLFQFAFWHGWSHMPLWVDGSSQGKPCAPRLEGRGLWKEETRPRFPTKKNRSDPKRWSLLLPTLHRWTGDVREL